MDTKGTWWGVCRVRKTARGRVRIALAITMLLAATVAVAAQPDGGPGVVPAMASRLAAERLSAVDPGLYGAGDRSFVLEPYGAGKYLLRFVGSSENFVLTAERGSLGARILKYDTGTTALRVSVWGGLTLYTQDNPGGLPATRQGDTAPTMPMTVTSDELATAFTDESGHMTYVQKVALKFSADPAVMQADPETRGRAFDALINAAAGIERFLASLPVARQVFAKRINAVKVAEGGKPTITIAGSTLLVSFVPSEGHEGHASSLAIEQELTRLFPAPASVATK